MDEPLAIILAAGKSTRMKSSVPKVLHDISGRRMIDYVLDAARKAGVKRLVVVVGHQADVVQQALQSSPPSSPASRLPEEERRAGNASDRSGTAIEFALQEEQLGTGHAVMMCERQLEGHHGPVLVLAGDTPLLKSESLQGLLDDLREQSAACVIGTAVTEACQGLGRIVRDSAGNFERIVEEKDASEEEKAIQEVNTGCYAFDSSLLLKALGQLRPENEQDEYYLTDCPAILLRDGHTVVASNRFDIREAMGINTQEQLAEVERVMQTG